MHRVSENIFQHIGDLGDVLTSDILTSPIRRMINRDAERAGIDIHNPCRSVASLLGSCGMATALGAFLGPPGGILGGLLGYVVATGSEYEGNWPESAHKTKEEALYLLELEALQIAAEVTQSLVDPETWDEICCEVCNEIDSLTDCSDRPNFLGSAVDLLMALISESMG